ncbi:thioesterase II family protein [Amycolatopsis alba]|uniref:Thioesterase n=1 Tax=Amycolatopsis alba DSM 44262 TaxID=1125972 RepID=A0A229S2E7_AMYAL|nr:alpha/beta fold hydrolase [Amycolatopsis alba]OXM53102.1 thioesterase [Amycolatopsis alba DSM 44262]
MTGSWIRRFHPNQGAEARVVCLPHAGGSANFFHGLSGALAPAVEVLAVQYPGRLDRSREPLVDDIGVLADEITAALGEWAQSPLTLFGHSMGATVGFEVVRRLERDGGQVRGLFASGRRAPSCGHETPLHPGSDAEMLDSLVALGGIEPELLDFEDLVAMVVPVLRNDYRAIERYRADPGATVRCPLTVLTGDSDPAVDDEQAQAWALHATGGFTRRTFPGGHFYLKDHWPEIAGILTGHVRAAAVGS